MTIHRRQYDGTVLVRREDIDDLISLQVDESVQKSLNKILESDEFKTAVDKRAKEIVKEYNKGYEITDGMVFDYSLINRLFIVKAINKDIAINFNMNSIPLDQDQREVEFVLSHNSTKTLKIQGAFISQTGQVVNEVILSEPLESVRFVIDADKKILLSC